MAVLFRLSLAVSGRCKIQTLARIRQLTRHKATSAADQLMPLFIQAEKFKGRTAIIDQHGHHRYEELVHLASNLTKRIQKLCPSASPTIKSTGTYTSNSTAGAGNIALLCPNDVSFVVSQWGCWMAGGAAVPLCSSHPESQLRYFLTDSQAKLVIYTGEFSETIRAASKDLDIQHLQLEQADYLLSENEKAQKILVERESNSATDETTVSTEFENELAEDVFRSRNALIIYTSGTTGPPKGVVHSFSSLHSSMSGMIEAWVWSDKDVILHVLPLHHVHGIVNALMTPLAVGATCVMLPKFHAQTVWQHLLQPHFTPYRVNVLMAVPTIYVKLIEEYRRMLQHGEWAADTVRHICSSELRLMVSGSAALPVPVLETWRELSDHVLLERYGMTETLMVLTNPYTGTRTPGCVGEPFPDVEVCIVAPPSENDEKPEVVVRTDNNGTVVTPGQEEKPGELYVKGASLFSGYYNKVEATTETFTRLASERWFKTGDTACYKEGTYRILGRSSVDIIKSAGYKISALEIERLLLEHAAILDVAVVGVQDPTYGERIGAVVASKQEDLSLEDVREWAKDKMPAYWLPTLLRVVQEIPRNAMGKVNKKELLKTMFANGNGN